MALPCRSCIAWQLTAIWLLLLFLLVARLRPHPPSSEAGCRGSGGGTFRRERHARGPRALPTAGASSVAPVPAAQPPEPPEQQRPQPQLAGRPWSPQVAAVVTAADAPRRGAPLGNLSSAALVAELHSRAYGWEVLHAARLDFRDFSELDLVSWLRRDTEKFRAVLASASLGLGAFTPAELLREASARPDLGQALAATGLGSGSDFSCAQDESPRDGGCQIRCQSRECPRAHAVCRAIKHCVKVDVNKGGTWATLKSLQVYAPRPPPVCEGYAFSEEGVTPSPITVAPVVRFEVDRPNETWCYRDTGGDAATKHREAVAAGGRCTAASCFDYERCRGATEALGPSLYVHGETPRSYDMARLPSCLRQVHAAAVVEDAERACLVLPTVNINCEWDTCDPSTHMQLRALKTWGGKGRNHLIWDYNDARRVRYRTDDALYVKTSMHLDDYRPGFDVPFPLLPNGVASHVSPAELRAASTPGKRHLLLSFKGTCQAASLRGKLSRLHNGKDVIIACSDSKAAGQHDYRTLMLTSTFSAAPAGNGLHSYRLAEAIFLGSIPVLVDAKLVLPFCSVIDWQAFSVRVTPQQIPQLPQLLRAIPAARVAAMQARLAEVKRRYLLHPFSTALSLIGLRARIALAQRDKGQG